LGENGSTLLRRLFVHERQEVIESWTKLCYEEHNDLNLSPVIKVVKSRRRWSMWHAWDMRNTYKVLDGKSEEKRQH
jgi:hypothetical protein